MDITGKNGINTKKETVEEINKNHNNQDVGDAWGCNSYVASNVIAKMPVAETSIYYNMSHKNRGNAIIFNHEHFDIQGLKSRSGTNVDAECLKKCLLNIGFKVDLFDNLKYKDIQKKIVELAEMDHADNDCVLIAILSHGEMGIIYAFDTHYKLESLWSPFTADRCPTLAGKPKMFFIQACQGDKLDGGVTMSRTETDGLSMHTYRIPTHADFLIAYSTIPGFFSWRNTTRGSWFIQALCEELTQNGKKLDLLTLLTMVSRRVAIGYESNVPDTPFMHKQKQIPCITSMLTRLIVFADNSTPV